MKEILIHLNTIEDAKEFVGVVADFDGEVTIVSGRYIINAKSVLGVFSVDLSKSVKVCIERPTPEKLEAIQKFIVQE